MTVRLLQGDCLHRLKELPDNSIDAIVTDPPYGLSKEPDMAEVLRHWMAGDDYTHTGGGFMGKTWDSFVPGPSIWKECMRVLKPGGHLLAFFGSRTYDVGSLAIRLAGFEIRDQMMWMFSQGFPKSLDVSKAMEKADAAPEVSKEWEGWGTALKPAHEPICVARKPLIGTVVENVLAHGTGALNIDASRVPTDEKLGGGRVSMGRPKVSEGWDRPWMHDKAITEQKKVEVAAKVALAEELGRWPANIIHDGSDEVLDAFAAYGEKTSGKPGVRRKAHETHSMAGRLNRTGEVETGYGDSGSAARFFYCAKASAKDRAGSKHPTVKPVSLMSYLVKLVTPPGGTVLDPFAGSGTTGEAAAFAGFDAILIEREAEYAEDIRRRLAMFLDEDTPPPLH